MTYTDRFNKKLQISEKLVLLLLFIVLFILTNKYTDHIIIVLKFFTQLSDFCNIVFINIKRF